jgi:putative FmdB family regulatory protein
VPLFEFECHTCHHRFERIQSFSGADPACVKCGGKVERLLTAPAVQFKGSGWYATDYPKPGSKSESKAGEKSESKSDTKSDSSSPIKTDKSETRSESKSPSKSDANSGSGSKE